MLALKRNEVAGYSTLTLQSRDRRMQIVRAAYCAIAEKGFEGLRMREIAVRVGLNHATLHYYFQGKEALIAGVMDYMAQELSLGRDNWTSTRELSPREQLAAHFATLLRQAREHPEMFVVLGEIHARSARDPGIRAVMRDSERGWKKFISGIIRAGVRCGDFRPTLDADDVANIVIALIRGLNLGYSSPKTSERVLRQIALWLQ